MEKTIITSSSWWTHAAAKIMTSEFFHPARNPHQSSSLSSNRSVDPEVHPLCAWAELYGPFFASRIDGTKVTSIWTLAASARPIPFQNNSCPPYLWSNHAMRIMPNVQTKKLIGVNLGPISSKKSSSRHKSARTSSDISSNITQGVIIPVKVSVQKQKWVGPTILNDSSY